MLVSLDGNLQLMAHIVHHLGCMKPIETLEIIQTANELVQDFSHQQ